jgi:tRNA (Thr-GGU) A37 N-methylase
VTGVRKNILEVENIDMIDQTPVLDIKPHITGNQ